MSGSWQRRTGRRCPRPRRVKTRAIPPAALFPGRTPGIVVRCCVWFAEEEEEHDDGGSDDDELGGEADDLEPLA